MLNFNGLSRYPKKSETSDWCKKLKTNFLQDADKLFGILCCDNKQRKQCEIQYGFGMTFNDPAFF